MFGWSPRTENFSPGHQSLASLILAVLYVHYQVRRIEDVPPDNEPPITSHESRFSDTPGHRGSRTEHQGADDDVSLLDSFVVVAENLRLLILGPLAAGLVALGIAYLIAPTYTARTSFLPPQQQQSTTVAALAQLGALAGVAASSAGLRNPAAQYVALLESTTVADRLVDRFRLMQLYDVKFRQDARKHLARRTDISARRDGLIVVEVDDDSPQRAADIANAYVSELVVLMGRLALTEAQQRRVFFERQLESTKGKLTQAQRALSASGVTAGAIKANPAAAVAVVAQLRALVTAQEVKLTAMRGYLSESAAEFTQAQTELAALRAQLRREQASESVSTAAGDYIEKYRDFKYQETLFELFARQFELAKADESREGALIQVVDLALPPERKSRPKRALIATLTTLAAGLILLIVVFARKSITDAARSGRPAKLAAIRGGLVRLFMWKWKRW